MATYNTYTSPNGQTQQGAQFDANSLAARDMSTAQLAPMYTQQVAANAQLQSPETRAAAVNNSNIPAMQANYEGLAKQLFQYDQMNLAPQYGGTPTDQPGAASFGRVGASTLSQLTPESVESGAVGLKNANPAFGIGAQVNQGNLLVDLLSNLNSGIEQEFTSTRGRYKSSVDKSNALLTGLLNLLDRAQAREEAAKNRAATASGKASDNYNSVVTMGDKLKSDLATGLTQWGDAWNTLKNFADRNGVKISPAEIDQILGGRYDPSDPTGAKGLTVGWAKPGAAQDYASGLRYKQTGTSAADDVDFKSVISGLDSYLTRREGTSLINRANPTDAKGIAINTERDSLSRILAKLVEKNRISDQDAKFYLNQLPAFWMDDEQAKAKIDGIKNALATKLGIDASSINSVNGGGWE